MKLGIIGAVVLGLGIWALKYSWWFVVEIIEGLIALGLVVGGALAIAIAMRRMYRAKQMAKQEG
jgi:protein-S-isoprenylcysteine O-methyltransferase Ste14